VIHLALRSEDSGFVCVWSWQGGGFRKAVTMDECRPLFAAQKSLEENVESRAEVAPVLERVGRLLGEIMVGEPHAELLHREAARRAPGFRVCFISADVTEAMDLAWEGMILPGATVPLFYDASLRGAFEYARLIPAGNAPVNPRRERKCLFAHHGGNRDPLIMQEANDLRIRLLGRPSIIAREAPSPDRDMLSARLRLECALFLFVGHGGCSTSGYRIGLRGGSTNVADLLDDFTLAGPEVIVFDSCESGLWYSGRGLPSLLTHLERTTCLVGMQTRAPDTLCRIHVPWLVEQLLLGVPAWEAVNVVRLQLFEEGRHLWFVPGLHLKRNYRPFSGSEQLERYLTALLQFTEESRTAVGPSVSSTSKTEGLP
jgi:hypothetical protein